MWNGSFQTLHPDDRTCSSSEQAGSPLSSVRLFFVFILYYILMQYLSTFNNLLRRLGVTHIAKRQDINTSDLSVS